MAKMNWFKRVKGMDLSRDWDVLVLGMATAYLTVMVPVVSDKVVPLLVRGRNFIASKFAS